MARAHFLTAFAAVLLAAMPAACGSIDHMVTGSTAVSLPTSTVSVSTSEAASFLASFRAQNGRGKLVVSSRLMAAAVTQAKAMAAANEMSHYVGGEFTSRLAAAGYEPSVAAENIAVGVNTLDAAMVMWRDSPPHRANMLIDSVTEFGIAAAHSPGGRMYWALVLGHPR